MRPRLLLAAVASLALAGCGDEAEPGDVVKAVEVDGPTQSIRLPTGKLAVTVSEEPADHLPDGLDGPGGGVADGGRWYGVAWNLQPSDLDGLALIAMQREPHKAATLALVADGRRYPIGPAYEVEKGRWIQGAGSTNRYVAVAGDPEHVAVAVTLDGVTQTIDPGRLKLDPGGARALYSTRTSTERTPCTGTATARPALRGVHFTCEVIARARVGYVGGLGWAKPGRTWAVVDVYTGLSTNEPLPSWPRPGGGSVRYRVSGASRTYKVGDQFPVETIRTEDGPVAELGGTTRTLVFDVPERGDPGTISIDQRLRLIPSGRAAGAPEHVDLVVRQRVPIVQPD